MGVAIDKASAEVSRSRRFVVLHHVSCPGRADHYDLLLELRWGHDCEARDILAFATVEDKLPLGNGELLVALERHRRFYLSHEGPLLGPTMRGKVKRVDEGTIEFIRGVEETSIETIHSLSIALSGRILNGRFILRQKTIGKKIFFSFNRPT